MSKPTNAANRPGSASVQDLMDTGAAQAGSLGDDADGRPISVRLADRVIPSLGRRSRLGGGSGNCGEAHRIFSIRSASFFSALAIRSSFSSSIALDSSVSAFWILSSIVSMSRILHASEVSVKVPIQAVA